MAARYPYRVDVEQSTRRSVDGWWSELLGVAPERLWHDRTVRHPHGRLGDLAGWYVAWRADGVHVSAPSSAAADEVASLRTEAPLSLQEPAFWAAFAAQRGLELRGPVVHAYLDDGPEAHEGTDGEVVEVEAARLEEMRGQVTRQEWDAWATDQPARPVAVLDGGRLVAAASLGPWDGRMIDVGVLTVPDHRGRGLATRVGRACASHAVREHGVALWRAAPTNVASVRTAARIGFEPYVTQLVLRPRVW
jgi:RimJ/RimL family protein N-acetyltransferase